MVDATTTKLAKLTLDDSKPAEGTATNGDAKVEEDEEDDEEEATTQVAGTGKSHSWYSHLERTNHYLSTEKKKSKSLTSRQGQLGILWKSQESSASITDNTLYSREEETKEEEESNCCTN